MNKIRIDKSIMEKLLIKSDYLGIDKDELASNYISRCLNEDTNQCNEVNPIHDLLSHDKPEGDKLLK